MDGTGADGVSRRAAAGEAVEPTGEAQIVRQGARTHDYRGAFGADGTRVARRREIPEVTAERGTVVEDPASGFCGAVVRVDVREVTLEDRHGRHRVFPLRPGRVPGRRAPGHAGAPDGRARGPRGSRRRAR